MTKHQLTSAALALFAAAGIALAPGAQAQQSGTSTPGSSGRPCTDDDRTMADGDVITWRRKDGSKGSITCTNGTTCHTWRTRQGNGSWVWFSECREGGGQPW